MKQTTANSNLVPSSERESALQRVLTSDTFANSGRLRELLEYIVQEANGHDKSPVKAASIAYDLYGRDIAKDRQGDAIVRVDASRLRRKLELYYLTEGAHEPVRIDIPKGSYIPVFDVSKPSASNDLHQTDSWKSEEAREFGLSLQFDQMSFTATGTEMEHGRASFSDELEIALSRIPWLELQSRNTGQPADFSLAGQLRVVDDKVRISAKLTSFSKHRNIWAERFECDRSNELFINDDIVIGLSCAVERELFNVAKRRAMRKSTDERDHWDHYFCGVWHQGQRRREDLSEAFKAFEKAVELQPGFAIGYAAMAETHFLSYIVDPNLVMEQVAEKSLAAANNAINKSQENWLAHRALGVALQMSRRQNEAVQVLEYAVKLNPLSAITHLHLASALMFAGKVVQAVDIFKTCLKLDPMDLYISIVAGRLGLCHLLLDDYSNAEY